VSSTSKPRKKGGYHRTAFTRPTPKARILSKETGRESKQLIVDGRETTASTAEIYDLVIIGTGPAGITLAQELENTGLKVALLESGGLEFDAATQALYDGPVTALDVTDLTAARLRQFGGTSNHWGGHCLPLDEIDFERPPLSGMSGWPFERSALEGPYERAHAYCDLGAYDYSLSASAELTEDDLLLYESPVLETSVIRQSPPTLFGEKYRKAFEDSPDIQVWLWTNATEIDISEDGIARSVKTRTLEGTERTFRGRQVILAGGAVENARLLLNNNQRSGQAFGNAGDLLGKCYMDHATGGAAFLWLETPVTSRAYWQHDHQDGGGIPLHYVWRLRDEVLQREGLANTQFFLIPFPEEEKRQRINDANRGWRSLKNIAKWSLGRGSNNIVLSDEYCNFIQNADAIALDVGGFVDRGDSVTRLLLRYEAELQPTRDSYVFLSDQKDALGQPRAGLHWSPTEVDRDSIVRSATLIGKAAGATGLGRLEMEDHFDARYWDANTAWHQIGTTRMSSSENQGVVDADCRVHGTANLYVAGGSVMPSGGRANPTLTIVALAIRLADHIKSELSL